MITRHAASLSLLSAVAFGLFTGACGGEKRPVDDPSSEALPAVSSETKLTSAEVQRVSPTIAVSAELAHTCKFRLADLTNTPKFEFDKSELLPADLDALGAIADCLTVGPLKGRAVMLIGRADPRGTTEYNMSLGAKRAGSVGAYLAQLGVAMNRVNVTSRGELDAVGIDEMGWQIDRRVDIVLAE